MDPPLRKLEHLVQCPLKPERKKYIQCDPHQPPGPWYPTTKNAHSQQNPSPKGHLTISTIARVRAPASSGYHVPGRTRGRFHVPGGDKESRCSGSVAPLLRLIVTSTRLPWPRTTQVRQTRKLDIVTLYIDKGRRGSNNCGSDVAMMAPEIVWTTPNGSCRRRSVILYHAARGLYSSRSIGPPQHAM